jgi:hypothetical protein
MRLRIRRDCHGYADAIVDLDQNCQVIMHLTSGAYLNERNAEMFERLLIKLDGCTPQRTE